LSRGAAHRDDAAAPTVRSCARKMWRRQSGADMKALLGGWHLVAAAMICAAASLASGSARAQMPIPGYPPRAEDFDAREIAMLPRYCLYTQMFRERVPGGNDPAMISQW